ncbi:MliC family protein [Lysobacter claricitrinus]|uniref:MliC family protein n=1 Tax=Lysobacter claricitrinus TaxID=3367728 RepID=UPI0037DBB533
MNPRNLFVVAAAGALLTGCPFAHSPEAASNNAAAPSAAVVRGNATYVERVKMPPGASLHVELTDAASQAVLASKTLGDVAGPPYPFELHVPSTAHPAGYALRATLSGADGQRWFETPAPVGVTPGGAAVELRMRRVVAEQPTPAVAATGAVAHWECGDLGVMSRFDDAPRQVRLSYNGASLALPITRSASGARYADARGNEFWTKGATGTLALAGEPPRDCVQALQVSPWNQAVLAGATFRAIGNEPGWSAEITGTPPRLEAQLDYGQTRVVAPLQVTANGYTGADASGNAVHVTVRKERCRDGMSGQAFEASVTLDVAGTTYHGCGANLQD